MSSIEQRIGRDSMQRAVGNDRLALDSVHHHGVADMRGAAVAAGHVPAAPSPPERRPVVGIVAAELRQRQAVGCHEDAAREQSRHVQRAVVLVAAQTRRPPLDDRTLLRLLLDGVEEHALLRVLDGELEQRRAADVADRDRVIEEDGARVCGAGVQRLDAGLRHHQHLRCDWNVQRAQHRPQVAGGFVEVELDAAVFDRAIQRADHIVRGFRVVANLRMRQGAGQRPFRQLLRRHAGHHRERASRDRGDSGHEHRRSLHPRLLSPKSAPSSRRLGLESSLVSPV
jgi:hypothetical protein